MHILEIARLGARKLPTKSEITAGSGKRCIGARIARTRRVGARAMSGNLIRIITFSTRLVLLAQRGLSLCPNLVHLPNERVTIMRDPIILLVYKHDLVNVDLLF